MPDLLVDYARLHDLTIVPVPESYDQWYAEAVIFGSGRPTLILPRARGRVHLNSAPLPSLGISAAPQPAQSPMRMPLLENGQKGEDRHRHQRKNLDSKHSAEALAKNLARHGIDVVLDKVDADGRPIGEVLETYTVSHRSTSS